MILRAVPASDLYSRQGYAFKLNYRQDYVLMPLSGLKRLVREIKDLRCLSRQDYGLGLAKIWFKLQGDTAERGRRAEEKGTPGHWSTGQRGREEQGK